MKQYTCQLHTKLNNGRMIFLLNFLQIVRTGKKFKNKKIRPNNVKMHYYTKFPCRQYAEKFTKLVNYFSISCNTKKRIHKWKKMQKKDCYETKDWVINGKEMQSFFFSFGRFFFILELFLIEKQCFKYLQSYSVIIIWNVEDYNAKVYYNYIFISSL